MSNTDFSVDASKPFWASQTIWASLAVIGASLAGATLSARSGDVAGLSAALTSILGATVAIAGRYKARTPLAPPFG
jgi:hypothetical protein